jgi:hypothetical protein
MYQTVNEKRTCEARTSLKASLERSECDQYKLLPKVGSYGCDLRGVVWHWPHCPEIYRPNPGVASSLKDKKKAAPERAARS